MLNVRIDVALPLLCLTWYVSSNVPELTSYTEDYEECIEKWTN